MTVHTSKFLRTSTWCAVRAVKLKVLIEEVKHLDTATVEVGKRPKSTLAFNADAWFHRDDQAQLRDCGRRFEQANFCISSDVHPQTNFVHWLTLFRANPDAQGSEDERKLLAGHRAQPHPGDLRQAASGQRGPGRSGNCNSRAERPH